MITKDSLWFNAPVLIAITVALVAAAAAFIDFKAERRIADAKLDVRLSAMDAKIDSGMSDRWRLAHQREWAHEVKKNNPAMSVPDPDIIATRIK